MKKYDVVIVGGGAAGMACALTLANAQGSLKILIIEAADRLGKKLSATGNGQGNVSNIDMSVEHFRGGNIELIKKTACSDELVVTRLFNCIFSADDKGRIYPAGRQASALTDSLIHSLIVSGVEIMPSTTVNTVKKGFILELSDGSSISAEKIVLCTGGVAQPANKTSSPYAIAESFGHRVTPLYPSLVQLKTEVKDIKTLKGIRADCKVNALIDGKVVKSTRGDVIFTDYGVSGNAIFSISPVFADNKGKKRQISIEFLPDISSELIINDIDNKKKINYADSELLSGTVHNQIGRAVIRRAGVSDSEKIVKTLKNFTLDIVGTLGFAYAQVTCGGLDMSQISDNFESKIAKGMYFAGEVLDVDGDCGGYNLQWAFTSGIAAANSILERIRND